MTAVPDHRRRTLVGLLATVAVGALGVAVVVPAVVRTRAGSTLIRCRDNLRQVGLDLAAYGRGDGGDLPLSPTVENPQDALVIALVATGNVGSSRSYYCPGETRPDLQYGPDRFRAGDIGYFYYGARGPGPDPDLSKFLRSGLSWPRQLNAAADPHAWAMSDRWASGAPTAHAGYRKGVNYLAADGSVGFVADSPRRSFK